MILFSTKLLKSLGSGHGLVMCIGHTLSNIEGCSSKIFPLKFTNYPQNKQIVIDDSLRLDKLGIRD